MGKGGGIAGFLVLNQLSLSSNFSAVNVQGANSYGQSNGFDLSKASVQDTNIETSIEDGVQVIKFDLEGNDYPTLNLKANMPTKLIVNVEDYKLTSCNSSIYSLNADFQHDFTVGENIIEIPSLEEGEYVYTCWMGMIGANIYVSEDLENPSAFYDTGFTGGSSCCGGF